jgi:hypothetical protein
MAKLPGESLRCLENLSSATAVIDMKKSYALKTGVTQAGDSVVDKISQSCRMLLNYCRNNDWAGFDPYDALNSPLFRYVPIVNFRFARLVATQLLKRSPVNIRQLLLIPKTHNPKALALFLMAFIKLSRLGLLKEKGLIESMQERLKALRSQGTPYWCWGYSFPWQTRTVLVPKDASNIVCTSFVANAMLDLYENGGASTCLDMAVNAAEYIVNELYWTEGESTASFSYPLPGQHSLVHNANFLAAAFLCRAYRHSGERSFLEPALRAARYSASKQRADGSWDYGEGASQRWVDNFHTGYNLCALQAIRKNVGTAEFDAVIDRGFRYYKDHFFLDDGAPKYFDNHTYPLDVHSVAQSIITLLSFKELDDDAAEMALAVYEWAMQHLWNPQGYFYYQKRSFFTNRISYMRWSQAWMLLALATLITLRTAETETITSLETKTAQLLN